MTRYRREGWDKPRNIFTRRTIDQHQIPESGRVGDAIARDDEGITWIDPFNADHPIGYVISRALTMGLVRQWRREGDRASLAWAREQMRAAHQAEPLPVP